MASEFFLETQTPVTPKLRLVHRVSVGARCLASRSTPGLIGIEIRRGDGGAPEEYPTTVDFRIYGPIDAGAEIRLDLAQIDMVAAGEDPRTYQMRVVAIGLVADINVRDANIGTSPYSEPGIVGP